MIENDKQLRITIDWIGNFANGVNNLTKQELPTTTNDKLRYVSYMRSYIGMIDELLDQVNEYWNKDVTVIQQELDLTEIGKYIQQCSDNEVRYELRFTLLDQLYPKYETNLELEKIISLTEDRKIDVSYIMEQLFEWCTDNNVSYKF